MCMRWIRCLRILPVSAPISARTHLHDGTFDAKTGFMDTQRLHRGCHCQEPLRSIGCASGSSPAHYSCNPILGSLRSGQNVIFPLFFEKRNDAYSDRQTSAFSKGNVTSYGGAGKVGKLKTLARPVCRGGLFQPSSQHNPQDSS